MSDVYIKQTKCVYLVKSMYICSKKDMYISSKMVCRNRWTYVSYVKVSFLKPLRNIGSARFIYPSVSSPKELAYFLFFLYP
jgi:hypothetical protein